MLFNSYPFIFAFLPLVLIGFYGLSRIGKETAFGWLVISSLFFYAWWNFTYLLLIGSSILVNYFLGKILSNKPHKGILSLGISINLLALGYYKYFNFFTENLNTYFNTSFNFQEIILPLAISFFTFQQIAFLVDAYRKEAEEYNFLHYCLFVTFFPQLIAGPIVHHKEMLPQFYNKDSFKFNHSDFSIGCTIFVIGLFKKVFIADQLAPFANIAFDNAASGNKLSTFDAWAGTLAYSLQLYFDFSGYSDMAIGLARLFGVRLPLNFHSPYKSRNIIEFWRRWHMTLSRFLRDYLYIALGGNRKGSFRRYTNLSITMLLGGIWHGAGWQFLIWGGLHGLFLVINHFWRHIKPSKLKDSESKIINFTSILLSHLLTLLCVTIAWVFFRAENTTIALEILNSMIISSNTTILLIDQKDWLNLVIVASIIALFFPNTQEIMARYNPAFLTSGIKLNQEKKIWKWQPNTYWGILIIFLFLISISKMTSISEFLYFQF